MNAQAWTEEQRAAVKEALSEATGVLYENAETIAGFAKDAESAVQIAALIIDMGIPR